MQRESTSAAMTSHEASRWHRTFFLVRLPASFVMASLVLSMWKDGLSSQRTIACILTMLVWPFVWLALGHILFKRRRGAILLVAADGLLLALVPAAEWALPLLNLGATAIVINTIMTGGTKLLRRAILFVILGIASGAILWGGPTGTGRNLSHSTRTWLLSTTALVFEGILAASVAIRANIRLTETKRELAELNRVLDQKVKERTAALESTNSAISRFVPTEFLHALGHSDVRTAKLGDAVARELTVLFADIRHFTTISEQLSPQQTFDFLNQCLSKVGPHIRAQSGFIDKYIGDAIMALFPGSPADAVRAAIAMQLEVNRFNQEHPDAKTLAIGIGIHTGRVMMGTIGEEQRFEATVISDAVNLTARLETLTKQLDCSIVASADVLGALSKEERALTRPLGRFAVKGKRAPAELVEIFAAEPSQRRDAKLRSIPAFTQGLSEFQAGDYQAAASSFSSILAHSEPDGPALFWSKQCKLAMTVGGPVPEDGVLQLDRK